MLNDPVVRHASVSFTQPNLNFSRVGPFENMVPVGMLLDR